MNKLTTLFCGFLFTFVLAWLGLVIIPHFQFGQLQPFVNEDTGESFPPFRSGLANLGKQVYEANGCIYCHSQQVRPDYLSADMARGWGARRSVARDYIYDKPHLLGTMRTGPDLSNIGVRQPSEAWHHEHLYAPQSKSIGSTMPPFRYLYKIQKIQGEVSPNALKLTAEDAPAEGYEVVPTAEAVALVAYLKSLSQNYSLPEAKLSTE